MTYEDIKQQMPSEAHLRALDKIGYRYPRGESYFDIVSRLDPLVHEIESYREPLLIVSHQAVLRVLYAYLMGKPRSIAPKIEIPLHTVMKITCARPQGACVASGRGRGPRGGGGGLGARARFGRGVWVGLGMR